MTTEPFCAKGSEDLLSAIASSQSDCELGLHFTLTEYSPLGELPKLAPDGLLPSVKWLLLKSHLRLLDVAEIEAELTHQWDRFCEIFGRQPGYIDGHQHIHLLPQVRDVVLNFATEQLDGGWVRNCHLPMSEVMKLGHDRFRASVISILARSNAYGLDAHGLLANERFFGVNDFNRETAFGTLMDDWLTQAARFDGTSLIMCHPAMAGNQDMAIHDPIHQRRQDEFNYLKSDNFAETLGLLGLALQ